MSIVTKNEVTATNGTKRVEAQLMRLPVDKQGNKIAEFAPYVENEDQRQVSSLILKHFILSTVNQYTPRVELNDLSLVTRDQYDQMAFNTYQPNNGEAWEGDQANAWRSRALRPVVRNKCMTIAAHATARLIFPKVFAYNQNSEEQQDAAQVMEDLMEWTGDVSNYPHVALMRVITAMSSPASIGYTEYGEVTRLVKTEKIDGKWQQERIIDEAYPCFTDCVVPVTQLYIENVYEPDIQKQGFLIWRKVYAYSEAQTKYQDYDNFKYVRPGVQTIYDDANRQFYYVYDPNMRQEDVEEITYWNKTLDIKIIKVNGVMMTDYDNPNPRRDKLYPFDKFYYEPINSRFFYGKSLAFKLQHDADVVNTLYQMVIDGTYLSIFKPMVNVGGEIIASDVIVPGAVTTLSDPNADLRAINVGADLKYGLETLAVVEKSINESSQEPLQQGADGKDQNATTAYEISRLEANANTVLGLFLQMIAKHVKDFGKLRLGDIIQYLTIPEVTMIEDNPELVYKTFFVSGKGGGNNKRIELDKEMPDNYSEEEYMDASYDLLIKEEESKMQIAKVNPGLFRELKYKVTISPDVLNPKSDDLIRAFDLEAYDRMIAAPPGMFDPEETAKLLLHSNPTTKTDVDKYVAKQPDPAQQAMQLGQTMQPAGQMPAAGNSPLNSMGKKPKQATPTPQLATMGQ